MSMDSMGRISKEKDSSGNILRSFSYDTYGQLVRENNAELDKTFVLSIIITEALLRSRSMLTRPAVPLTGTATEKTNTYDLQVEPRLLSLPLLGQLSKRGWIHLKRLLDKNK